MTIYDNNDHDLYDNDNGTYNYDDIETHDYDDYDGSAAVVGYRAGEALTDVQTQLTRVDTKASILFGLTLAALTGGLAVGSKVHWHGFAVAAATATIAVVLLSLYQLGTAIRPALAGNYGFMRWAEALNADAVRDLLADDTGTTTARVRQLWTLSRSVERKYRRIRLAVDLLGIAAVSAVLTAMLTALGW